MQPGQPSQRVHLPISLQELCSLKRGGKEVEEVKEVEERKNCPQANVRTKFCFPGKNQILPAPPEPPLLPALYLLDAGTTPAGFRTTSSYALSSSAAQNHSAISQPDSSLWSLGGLTQGFVYDLGSTIVTCSSKVS